MKILVTILTFILTTSLTWGQADTVFIKYNKDKFEEKPNYKTDTIIFDTPNARQILYGTTVLPWTLNQQIAKGYGLYLNSVSLTPCKQNDKLTIEVKYWANCCHSFLCDLEVINDMTVNLIIYGYGATYCSCSCCFGLTYNISTMTVDEFDKLKYITINGNEKTKRKLK
jgi:hypothetical protein